ncbi:MAG: hypothetical protein JRJ14_10335, partial [Deltaproteobacteria bacterium]|nr:hypothetical protein [Deltaproteobacteria bacterium]
STVVEKGMGTINGVKGIGLATSPILQIPVTISGALLITTGVAILGTPLLIVGTHYLLKRIKGQEYDLEKIFTPNTKVIMSLAVSSALLVSVGTVMLPRTEWLMILHVITGYGCLVLSIVHVFIYRNIIKAQAKKYWNFLVSPKKMTAAKA